MCLAVFAHIEAVMGADQFEICLIDVIETVLIIRLIDTEDSEVCEKRQKTESGDSSCDAGGIVLLNSPQEEMVWKLFTEC